MGMLAKGKPKTESHVTFFKKKILKDKTYNYKKMEWILFPKSKSPKKISNTYLK